MGRYDDIIGLTYRRSEKHPPLSAWQRAAQFSAFAALTGYEDCVRERARLTERRAVLGEEERAELDRRLAYLTQHLAERPVVTLTLFVPDEKKDGGAYVAKTGAVRRVCAEEGVLVLCSGERVPLKNVCAFGGECFAPLDKAEE